MVLKDGCHLISHCELTRTDAGKLIWQSYIDQIVEISLQYPDYFFPDTARKIIPRDARNHRLYIYVQNGLIDAFCIVTIYCDNAEYLWAATKRGLARKGIMRELYWFIEDRIKDEEPEVERITAMCASLDSKIIDDASTEEDKERRKSFWQGTHTFHHKMNFDFTYKLKHCWGIGYHALVCMKVRANFGIRDRSQCVPYGYSSLQLPELQSHLSKSFPEISDDNLEINKKIQEHVRACLDAFDESFIRNIQPGISGVEEYIVKDNINQSSDEFILKLKGFTGLALVNPDRGIATAFAHTSKDSHWSSSDLYDRFEYSIQSPGLLQQIISEPSSTGFLIHSADLAEKSEINLRFYFETYYPSDEDASYKGDYTVFYRKRMGKCGFYSILYFATPLIPNILWYEDLWESFSDYSFTLILVILGYFSSLRVLDSSLRRSEYFDGLIKAVSPSGMNDDVAGKMERISEDITQQTANHYSAIVDQKKRAFKNSGHLMTNRCDRLLRLLECSPQLKEDVKNTPLYQGLDSLTDSFQAQQLWGFDSLDEIFDEYEKYPNKLNRFIQKGSNHLDLSSLLYEEVKFFSEPQWVANQENFLAYLDLKLPQNYKFILEPALRLHESTTELFRLSDSVLSNIFFEIFLNASRHGMINSSEDLNRKGRGKVSVFCEKTQINNSTAILVSNLVQVMQGDARKRFEKLPVNSLKKVESDLGSGLGGVADYLLRLDLGEIWEGRFYYENHDAYRVVISLKGLTTLDIV